MRVSLRFPQAWLDEAHSAYEQYVEEWNREELERCGATDGAPEPPQAWPDFLREYHYAELENSVYCGAVNTAMASDS